MAVPAQPDVWILTDGKIGDLVQCRGVAARLTSPDHISERVVGATGFWALPLPLMPVPPSERPSVKSSPIAPPYPDLVIASGRRAVPYLREIRRQHAGAMVVFLKDPRRLGRNAADFIWAPVHDRLKGEDVIATHTSPHGLSVDRMAQAATNAKSIFASCERPFVGVFLGGDSGSVKWDRQSSADFAGKLEQLPSKGTLLVVPSRRTPDVLKEAVRDAVSDRSAWLWDQSQDNLYLETLAIAERIVVTGDSHNMVSEALSTGKPVYVYRPPNLQKKLHAFLDAMEEFGSIKNFDGILPEFSAVKIDATREIAEAIAERLAQFQSREI